MTDEPLKIAIVGGGLGGLSFALACHRFGIPTDVYEQASAFKEIGNGVALQNNASSLINEYLGIEEEYAAISSDLTGPTYMSYADYVTGEIQGGLPMPSNIPINSRPHRCARSDLLDLFRKDLPPSSLHTGKRLRELERNPDSTYTLHFTDSSIATADLVVGSDGIHSTVRTRLQRVLSLPFDEPVYSGQVAYRALVPQTAFQDTPEVQDTLFTPNHRSINFRGPGKHLLFFAVGSGGRLGNVVAFIPEARQSSESWTAQGEVSELAKEVEGWCEPARRVVAEMGRMGPKCLKQALYYRRPLERWHDGSCVVLGDAAHPILPHQGQGTGMAVEDGVALALLLKGTTKADLAKRLDAYVAVRKPRTDRMLQTSIAMGKVSSSATLTEEEKAMMSDRSWIWNYDLRKEVQEKLDEM